MNVTINSIHFDAAEKLEQFINKKVEKLAKHNEEISAVEVTLKVVKPETAMNKEASIKLNADLFASKVADTFEEAVDQCVDALKRQLEKSKKDK